MRGWVVARMVFAPKRQKLQTLYICEGGKGSQKIYRNSRKLETTIKYVIKRKLNRSNNNNFYYFCYYYKSDIIDSDKSFKRFNDGERERKKDGEGEKKKREREKEHHP